VGWFLFFSFEGVSAPKHNSKGGEDAYVYGLMFGKFDFEGELVVD
jgi:hypothetical protein